MDLFHVISAKRPKRPCLFCETYQSDLRRHIILKHNEEERVKGILKKEKEGIISREERIEEFRRMRKEGIYKKNIAAAEFNSESLIPMKKSAGEKVICVLCKGVYNKKYIHQHKKQCDSDIQASSTSASHPMTPLIPEQENTEFQKILLTMKRDDVFDIIERESLIRKIGEHCFLSKKSSKRKEAKIKARNAMRRLSKLLLHCSDAEKLTDLFQVRNFYNLEEAIIKLCQDDKSSKPGLNIALGTLLKFSSKFLESHFLITQQKELSRNISEFRSVLTMYYPRIVSAAEYALKEKRQRESRKPASLPNEENLKELKSHLRQKIAKFSKENIKSRNEYVQVRKTLLSEITLLNARRGSEVGRMTLKDYMDRDTWISVDKLSGEDMKIYKSYSVTFLMGKGNRLVPILIPRFCEICLNKIVDKTVRKMVGVSESNQFVFAYTENSDDSITGYNEIRDLCKEIQIPVITATSMRHRASTMFWSMEGISEDQVTTFMEHMGHSRDINKNIYAVPPALKTLQQVVPIVEQLDKVRPIFSSNQLTSFDLVSFKICFITV